MFNLPRSAYLIIVIKPYLTTKSIKYIYRIKYTNCYLYKQSTHS